MSKFDNLKKIPQTKRLNFSLSVDMKIFLQNVKAGRSFFIILVGKIRVSDVM